jgi:hypothetical protein
MLKILFSSSLFPCVDTICQFCAWTSLTTLKLFALAVQTVISKFGALITGYRNQCEGCCWGTRSASVELSQRRCNPSSFYEQPRCSYSKCQRLFCQVLELGDGAQFQDTHGSQAEVNQFG